MVKKRCCGEIFEEEGKDSKEGKRRIHHREIKREGKREPGE